MKRNTLKADSLLLLAAVIWGGGFIAQRVAAGCGSVFLFNGVRFLLGALVILPFTRWRGTPRGPLLRWSALAGALLFLGSFLQQAGLQFTTAGNAGFLTGLYVVFVPLFLLVAWRRRVPWLCWLAAGLAAVGVFLLSADAALRLGRGDVLELLGAVAWALHTIVLGLAVQRLRPLPFSVGQYLVAGGLQLVLGLALEGPALGRIAEWAGAVAYGGLISVGIAYTLQAVGQRHAPPADAAVILSTEAVFAALFGWLLLREILAARQLAGCALLLAAMLLAQVRRRPPRDAAGPPAAEAALHGAAGP